MLALYELYVLNKKNIYAFIDAAICLIHFFYAERAEVGNDITTRKWPLTRYHERKKNIPSVRGSCDLVISWRAGGALYHSFSPGSDTLYKNLSNLFSFIFFFIFKDMVSSSTFYLQY